MAKLTAPLFSLRASGTIGEALTYAAWKGISYVRTRVIPNNPQSAAQTAVREVFKTLNNIWNNSPQLFRDPWTANASGKPYTDRNKFLAINVPLLQGDANLADLAMSQQTNGAPAPTISSVTPGVGTLTVVGVMATLPVGWTAVGLIAAAIPDGDPNPELNPAVVANEDQSDPYSILLSGLAAASHRVGLWSEYLDASGVTRYSAAAKSTGTPT